MKFYEIFPQIVTNKSFILSFVLYDVVRGNFLSFSVISSKFAKKLVISCCHCQLLEYRIRLKFTPKNNSLSRDHAKFPLNQKFEEFHFQHHFLGPTKTLNYSSLQLVTKNTMTKTEGFYTRLAEVWASILLNCTVFLLTVIFLTFPSALALLVDDRTDKIELTMISFVSW